MSPRKVKTSVQLDRAVLKGLKEEAKRQRRSLSNLVDCIVVEALNRAKKERNKMKGTNK